MAVVLRDLRAGDWDTVISLFEALDDFHREALPWLFQKPTAPFRDRRFLATLADNERAQVFVAEEQGVVVGFVHVRLFDAPDLPVFVAQVRAAIDDIVVDPQQRRTGIARALLTDAEDWARSNGAVGVDLNVYDFNTVGQETFAAAGFEVLSRRMTKHLS